MTSNYANLKVTVNAIRNLNADDSTAQIIAVVKESVLDALIAKANEEPLDLLINTPTVDAINAGPTVSEWFRSLKAENV